MPTIAPTSTSAVMAAAAGIAKALAVETSAAARPAEKRSSTQEPPMVGTASDA